MIVNFLGYDCVIRFPKYGNGRTAIQLFIEETGEPMATASVNLPDVELTSDEVAIKNWSENEGILDILVDAGVVAEPHKTEPTGYTYAHICKFLGKE
jgi:hypothetical protein